MLITNFNSLFFFILFSLHIKNGLNKKCIDFNCKCSFDCINHYSHFNTTNISLECRLVSNYSILENTLAKINSTSRNGFCISNDNHLLTKVNITQTNGNIIIEALKQNLFQNNLVNLIISKGSDIINLPNNLFISQNYLQNLTITNTNLSSFNANHLFHSDNNLTVLNLESNQLTFIGLSNLKSLKILLLSNNQLTTLSSEIFYGNSMKNIEYLTIDNNPWDCNEELNWLLEFAKFDIKNIIQEKDQVKCSSPKTAKSMSIVQYLFVKEASICNRCKCLLRNKDAILVNCSNRNLVAMPTNLPSNTKIVSLENNEITNLTIRLSSLSKWKNVTYLILNNNTIESLSGLEGTKIFRNLVALHLSHNKLSEIPYYILDLHLSHLDELYLSDNPWRCDCNTVPFQNWLKSNFRVKDVDNIRCAAGNENTIHRNGIFSDAGNEKFANRILHSIPKSELCPQSDQVFDFIEVLNVVIALLIILICIKLVYDYFWQKRTGKLPRFFRINVR